MYLNSASKRSTGVCGCESETMRTFDKGTVGFSRRRAFAPNASDSLMGVDESIDRDPFEGGSAVGGERHKPVSDRRQT